MGTGRCRVKARYALARHWLWRITHPRDARRIAWRLRLITEVNRRIDIEDAIVNRLLANYTKWTHR